jgi:hypothetical protein
LAALTVQDLLTIHGETVTHYIRTLATGSRNATTGHAPVSYDSGTEVQAWVYMESSRLQSGALGGVDEQNWVILTRAAISRFDRIGWNSELFVISTDPVPINLDGVLMIYRAHMTKLRMNT